MNIVHKQGYNHLTLDLYLISLQSGRECSEAGHYITVTAHFPHSADNRLANYRSIEQFRNLLPQTVQLGQIQKSMERGKTMFFWDLWVFFYK
jgi:hypothetical protein